MGDTKRGSHVPGFVREADCVLRRLARARDHRLEQICLVAAALTRNSAWHTLGFANVNDFAREMLDRSGRWFRDHASLGAALHERPELSDAITGRDGGRPLGRVVAQRIGRDTTPESTAEWIAKARALGTHDFLRAIREAKAQAQAEAEAKVEAKTEAEVRVHPVASYESAGIRADETDTSEDEVARHGFSIRLPAPVRVAFNETRELFRAVSGNEPGTSDFLEAMSAECAALGMAAPTEDVPPEFRRRALEPRRARLASRESASKRLIGSALHTSASTNDPKNTCRAAHRGDFDSPALRDAHATLARLASEQRVLSRVTDVRAVQVRCNSTGEGRRQLRALVRSLRACVAFEDEIERRIGALLAELDDRSNLSSLGFGRAIDYAVERLGISATTARTRVQTERALRRLPIVRQAYESGAIGQRAALLSRKSLRTASTEMQSAFVERAQRFTYRRLYDESRMMEREQLLNATATYCDAVRGMRSGGRAKNSPQTERFPDDQDWWASIERVPGHTWARIVDLGLRTLDLCALRRGMPDRTTPIDIMLHLNLPQPTAAWFLGIVESVRQQLMKEVAKRSTMSRPSVEARESPALRIARTLSTGALPSWVALLAMLEECGATWDDVRTMSRRPEDPVHNRDGWRCAAPGCTSRRNLHTHHVVYRSHWGGDELSNRITLCAFHHLRGEHGDFLQVRGRAPLGLVWRLGHRDVGQWFVNDRRLRA